MTRSPARLVVPPMANYLPWLLIFMLLWLQELFLFSTCLEKVYFDKYGHCSKMDPFELSEDDYQVLSVGGGFSHETLDCQLTFKASSNLGICVTFKDMFIRDCVVSFLVYTEKNSEQPPWEEYTCKSEEPTRLCTSGRYLTLRVLKTHTNRNKGYDIDLMVREEHSIITEETVVFAYIGSVVGIIVGVIVFLILVALAVFWCCCRRRKQRRSASKQSTGVQDQDFLSDQPFSSDAASRDAISPSAPPLLEDENVSSLPLDSPPPYEHPPAYEDAHQDAKV